MAFTLGIDFVGHDYSCALLVVKATISIVVLTAIAAVLELLACAAAHLHMRPALESFLTVHPAVPPKGHKEA